MTRAIYYTASTLNGFLADENDSLSWLLEVPQDDVQGDIDDFLGGMGAIVMGSSTYDWVLREEGLLAQPERFQQFYGERPVFVVSSRDLPVPTGADVRIIRGDIAEHWSELRAAAGDRDVWVMGGGDLAGQFDDAGLLDGVIVTVAPATLRAGKPLLPRDLDWHRLELDGVRRIGRFAELTYRVLPRGAGD